MSLQQRQQQTKRRRSVRREILRISRLQRNTSNQNCDISIIRQMQEQPERRRDVRKSRRQPNLRNQHCERSTDVDQNNQIRSDEVIKEITNNNMNCDSNDNIQQITNNDIEHIESISRFMPTT